MYGKKTDYAKALENYDKCLEIQTKILGSDSIDVAKSLKNIGIMYRNKEDYAMAL